MNFDALCTILQREIAASAADVSVLWRELGDNARIFSHEADRRVVSASVIKVPILLALLEEVRLGHCSLDDRIPVPEAEILADSEVFDNGSRQASLEELATWMIVLSDNSSTNVLIEALGMDDVNAWCRSNGLEQTVLTRKMLDFDAIARGRNNYTSAADQFRLYDGLVSRSFLSPALCDTALHILKKQRATDLLMRYIWEDTVCAHKTGGLDYLCHDAGVFFGAHRTYFLGVFVENAAEIRGDRRLIGRLSRMVYDYYLTQQETML